MAASAWSVFWTAKKRLGNSGFSLGNSPTSNFRMSLHRSVASLSNNLLSGNVSTFGSISFMSSGGGVNAEGLTLTGVTWTSTAAGVYTFDASNKTYSPTSSALTSVRYAVIRLSNTAVTSGFPLCYAALSTASFDVGAGSTLTVQMATTGIFTLT
jgi:hypothetical protein